ncbi:SigE family RNA polymerase sigma factor [Streptomyces sp. NPDC087658]|uniref:SigE family RNA polymerase sigma factor n=1 Tax=Streptomyces sp. NPDC087658 TaxID=3365800 RepID=UPI0037FFD286
MTTPVCTSASTAAQPAAYPPHSAHPSRAAGHSAHPSRAAAHPSHPAGHSGLPSHLAGPSGHPAHTAGHPSHSAYPSFSSYVRARGPVLLRAARSLTANPCDAEDLLQTALTKTYVAWERIEDHRALDGYVRRALLNTRTSQWRKRKVDEFACEELPEPTGVPVPDPAERQVLHDAMWRAVMRLPDRQRAMVVLRYYEDLSEVQTAEVLGVSVGTVKSAVSRALGKLRDDPGLAPSAAADIR